jgi:hypothetical protein
MARSAEEQTENERLPLASSANALGTTGSTKGDMEQVRDDRYNKSIAVIRSIRAPTSRREPA